MKVPNATTERAMRAADKGKGKRMPSATAVFKDLKIEQIADVDYRSTIRMRRKPAKRPGNDNGQSAGPQP
jgi:hypothetical protein